FEHYYHELELRLLHRSDAIIAIAEVLVGILATVWNIHERASTVVQNWAPLDRLKPGNKLNAWSQDNGLAGKKIALYTGSLSSSENPLLLVQLAERLSNRSDIQIVVISEGAGAELVAREATSRSLNNLRVLPFQPY